MAKCARRPIVCCPFAGDLAASETDLAAEFHCFEKPNRVALIGDDLRLPDDGDRQQAHQKYAERKRDIGVRLSCRETKGANQPSHKDLLVPLVLRSLFTLHKAFGEDKHIGAISVPPCDDWAGPQFIGEIQHFLALR